ncbi:hypothetical protein T11_5557 [Trichinella zimbabwensis]|uniref:Uncharacterized protein n=1 Tax=Trichinella zimbabwensis TaxID=268475 RepID=A0A0V1HLK5_9BILA|nr:hypothetical protein T11_5557 [Trichinella zimbabwensis]
MRTLGLLEFQWLLAYGASAMAFSMQWPMKNNINVDSRLMYCRTAFGLAVIFICSLECSVTTRLHQAQASSPGKKAAQSL